MTRRPARRTRLLRWLAAAGCLAIVLGGSPAGRAADDAVRHRRGTQAGYLQPVVFTAPAGTTIAVAADGGFLDAWPAPALVGLQVAHLYRLRVEFANFRGAGRVYPTVELIDHLFPPPGRELEFPIPIELTEDDLELAAEGHFITRVIYLEDPLTALPTADDPQHPRWFDAGPGADPMATARELGRPVAILRLGGRVIDESTDLYGSFLGSGGGVVHYPSSALTPPASAPATEPRPLADREARAERATQARRSPYDIRSRYSPHREARP